MAAPLSHIWTRVIFANDNGVTGYLPTYLSTYLPTNATAIDVVHSVPLCCALLSWKLMKPSNNGGLRAV